MTGPLLLFLHAACPLLFFTDFTRNPYATQIYLLQAGLLAAALWTALSSWRRGAFPRRPSPLDAPVLACAAVALLSWGASWWAHPSLRPSIAAEGWRTQIFLWSNLVVPFFLALHADAVWEVRIRRAVLAVGAVAAAYGLLQYAGVEWIWDKALNPYNGRPVSTFGNPNFLSSYLVMLMPLALREFLRARPGGRGGWAALFVLYSAALICTMTRSSWIGAGAATVGYVLWVRPKGGDVKALAFLGGALAVMAFFWPGSPLAHGESTPVLRMVELVKGVTGREVYGSWHQRLLIWSCAWDMWRERWFLGKGWGCFELFYPFYQGPRLLDPAFALFRTHANNAHNLVLEVLSQMGLVGLAAAGWTVAVGVAALRRMSGSLPDDRRTLAGARAAALLGMALDNFFGNVSLFFAVPAFLFAWTAGAFASEAAGPARELPVRRPLPAFLLAAVLASGATGIVWCYRAWRAEISYFEGYKRSQSGDLAGAARHLEASRRWRRLEVNNAYELANVMLRQARAAGDNGLVDESKRLLLLAVDAYDEALRANAGYDEIHFNKATALLPLGRRDEAVAHLQTSLRINPQQEMTYRLLADVFARGGDAAALESLLAQAVRVFPANAAFRDAWEKAKARPR